MNYIQHKGLGRLIRPGLAGLTALVALQGAVQAETYSSEHHDFSLDVVVDGLEHPWSMAFLPSGDILVTERPGRLQVIRDGNKYAEVSGLPDISAQGQGGLLDLALHPDFEDNGWLYMSYSAEVSGGGLHTHVARGQYSDGELSNVEVLFAGEPGMSGGRHFGSRIVFDGDGYLYLTIGDRGVMESAQDTMGHAGTTVRLHDDGSVPDDNPFVGDDSGLDEIYTWGNRNAQGMAIHPETGEVWQNEHGPRGGDEINVIRGGLNYGWPEVTTGTNYDGSTITGETSHPDMEDFILDWTPSIAPSGKAFYTGDQFPNWRGDLFVGALAGQRVQRLRFDGTDLVEQEDLLLDFARIRDVRDGPDGTLWLLTDESDGRLIRLEP
ncbi:MAG: PQQ-dependent sugar dehydrogenase [Natronospirillum sp.]|uniref:PQQ-dependent sugar dehydrogenase n=1 Tax=Natronospirillum sp. TaxID=2812955 RepID=UPI0025D8B5DD|nr:PQQ-dependent sugar dehydrogenase [Natronospirillum sp.]MCH8552349.1 PQQ-dependent sugar dehydrogenase [Natronospirillum sp.]